MDGDKMMAVSIETDSGLRIGAPRFLFEGVFRAGFDIAPDGQRFLMAREHGASRPGELNVVLNWFEELERLVPTDK